QLPPVGAGGQLEGEPRAYTYGDLQALANGPAGALQKRGVAPGDRVLLLAENRPEWGITYFAVLKAGAAVVPVDSNATVDEVLNLVRSSKAKAAVISDKVWERLRDEDGLDPERLGELRIGFDELVLPPARPSPAPLLPPVKSWEGATLKR